MRISSRYFTLLTAVLLLTTAPNLARGHEALPAGPAEVTAYYQRTMLPVLQQQRRKLEPLLSAEDKKQLAACRQLRVLPADSQAAGPAIQFQTVPAAPVRLRPEAQQAVARLALKYEAPIARLLNELAPQRAQWQADINALQRPGTAPDSLAQHPVGPAQPDAVAELLRPEQFLLLPPAAEVSAMPVTTPVVFPNPSLGSNQLEYSVEKTGPVTVELLDGRGTTLRTLVQQEQQAKGPHTLGIPLGELAPGTYYYKITTRTGAEIQRFLKQ